MPRDDLGAVEGAAIDDQVDRHGRVVDQSLAELDEAPGRGALEHREEQHHFRMTAEIKFTLNLAPVTLTTEAWPKGAQVVIGTDSSLISKADGPALGSGGRGDRRVLFFSSFHRRTARHLAGTRGRPPHSRPKETTGTSSRTTHSSWTADGSSATSAWSPTLG
jgi:hypothetical protein